MISKAMPKRTYRFIFLFVVAVFACHKRDRLASAQRWQRCFINTNARLIDAHFISKDTGFLWGTDNGSPALFKSVDAGIHWEQVFHFDSRFPTFTCFYPLNDRHLVAGRDTLYQSNDGGASWSVSQSENAFVGSIRKFAFPNGEIGYALTGGAVYKSTDASNWMLIYPLEPIYNCIQFLDPQNGVIAGGSFVERNATYFLPSYGVLATTRDGGQTWKHFETGFWMDSSQNFNEIVAIYFFNANSGFVATDSKLLFTNDACESFQQRFTFPGTIDGLCFKTQLNGFFIAGQHVYETNDGGRSFRSEKLASSLHGITLTPGGRVLIFGDNG